MIPPYSYNGWGYGVYGNNVRRFTSWDEGISVVTTALRKEYMDARGAQNIYQIGSTYAADPNWANKVIRFINEIEAYKTRTEKPTLSITL
jgi:flagellum-specific peptidoglycan hydrolase FlgJ